MNIIFFLHLIPKEDWMTPLNELPKMEASLAKKTLLSAPSCAFKHHIQ